MYKHYMRVKNRTKFFDFCCRNHYVLKSGIHLIDTDLICCIFCHIFNKVILRIIFFVILNICISKIPLLTIKTMWHSWEWRTGNSDIIHSKNAILEMAIANFYHCKSFPGWVVESTILIYFLKRQGVLEVAK